MKWIYDWLKDYLDTDATAQEIADKLTEIGLEIESVESPIVPVVAKIVSVADIPDTHLHLLSVDDGGGMPRQVVCGAPNVRAGLVSALARPGCKIEGNIIKVGKIRGYESNGMMCSERELGQGCDHNGIVELDEEKYKIGAPLVQSGDAVFDATVLPNRPDYLAVRGIARDLAAAGAGKFAICNSGFAIKNTDGSRKAIIKNEARCPVYNFAEIHGIKLAPSHPKIASRLAAIGVNPKNAAVDATNYVCFDLGQPLHCFDADQIHGDIIIRNAAEGEEFTDLFDAKHILTAQDLVITDADGILALAGVVGGKRGMTTDSTKNIILESAYFEPIGIQKTRRRLGLSTDASYRYERGIDPTITADGLAMATQIITKECGGEIIGGNFQPGDYAENIIQYNPELFKKKTGIDLPADAQRQILERLGCVVENAGGAGWIVITPPARVNLEIPESLIADIIRLHGYDKVGVVPSMPGAPVQNGNLAAEQKIINIKKQLCKLGLTESISYGFGNAKSEKLLTDRPTIKIMNPIVDAMGTMRNNLIENMLNIIAENERNGFSNLGLFELGAVFDGDNPGQQHNSLIIIRIGIYSEKPWVKHGRNADIYDVRNDLAAMLGQSEITAANPPIWANPYRYGRMAGGEFGELHPGIAKNWKIKTPVVIGIIDNVDLIKSVDVKENIAMGGNVNANENNFLPITRDFAFVLDAGADIADIVKTAMSADASIMDANVFDVFDMGEGKKSVAFEVLIQPDKNLNSEELLAIQSRVIAAVEPLGAKIRDK